jgi:hypothetical protein
LFRELGLDRFEGGAIDDRLMLAGEGLPAINHLADIEAVLEKMSEGADAVRPATPGAAARMPRGNQGEKRATIRMRMAPGVG